jgi:hypothetical protein
MEGMPDAFTKRRLEKQNPKLDTDYFSDLAQHVFALAKTMPGGIRKSNSYLTYQEDLSSKSDADLIILANKLEKNGANQHPLYYLSIVDEVLYKRKIFENS